MTTRASITVTSNRAPPKRRHIPDRPPDGYHVTESEPIEESTRTPRDYVTAIRQAIAVIERLDIELIEIDEQIGRYETALTDPNADGWDCIDAEGKVAPLLERRNVIERDVLLATSDISLNGSRLINGWKEHEVDNVGKDLLTQGDGVLARAFIECPWVQDHPVWQRLDKAAVPYELV